MTSAALAASAALIGLKPWLDGQVVVLAARPLADDDVHAAVAEVLGLGVALRAVADDGDGLALERVEVGVFVVVNRGCHGVTPSVLDGYGCYEDDWDQSYSTLMQSCASGRSC